MKTTSKTALGGIIAAVSVAIMFLTFIPTLTYTLPAVAGALIIFMVIEVGKGWALLTYLAVGILVLLIAPDKEAAVLYSMFFGYYSILKAILETKLPRAVEWVLKFLIFNVSVVGAYFVIVFVFNLPIEEFEEYGKYAAVFLLVAGNIMFLLYDILLTKFIILYDRRLKRTFRKILK